MGGRNPQFSYVGSSGAMETYADPFANVTPAMVEAANDAQNSIIECKNTIEAAFMTMAFHLDSFDENKFYLALGYETMREWTEDTSVEVGWRVALDLLRIVREGVPVLMAHVNDLPEDDRFPEAVRLLAEAKSSKVRACLPLLSDGLDLDFIDLIEKAPMMPLKEVNKEVRRLRNNGEDEERPAVFVAVVKRGEKKSSYKIRVINGLQGEDIGTLVIPNEYTDRFHKRFGDFIEFDVDP